MMILNKLNITERQLDEVIKKLRLKKPRQIYNLCSLYEIVASNNEVVGLISFDMFKASNNTWTCQISAMEIADYVPYPSIILELLGVLFNATHLVEGKNIHRVYVEIDNEFISFWTHIGANFHVSPIRMNEIMASGQTAGCSLTVQKYKSYIEQQKRKSVLTRLGNAR